MPAPSLPGPGLCAICVNVRVIESGKGSRFYLCKLSSVDARFPRYPRLPVLECAGFERRRDIESESISEG